MTEDSREAIAARQAALVAALVTGGDVPEGVDAHRVAVAADALLRKRAGEVAWRWPALLASAEARERFRTWARHRPRSTSFEEGWDFAEHLKGLGALEPAAAAELAAARRRWSRRTDGSLRRRHVWAVPRAVRRRAG